MIIFREAGPWSGDYTVKGADLDADEIDGNFWDHEQRIKTLEEAGTAETNSITNIEVIAGTLRITTADGTVFGPWPLPVAIPQYRGDFGNAIPYHILDQITVPGSGLFLVLQDHAGVAPFDPARQIGGNAVYKLLTPPGAQGPQGIPGQDGDEGPVGPQGTFKINSGGPFASRAFHDSEPLGYTYISFDGDGSGADPRAMIYIKGSDADADWDGPYEWEGTPGENGAPGQGFRIDAAGLFATRDDYLPVPFGWSYLSTDGDGPGGDYTQPVIFIQGSLVGEWLGPFPFLSGGSNGLHIDALGTYAGRAAYDAEDEGFVYLATDGAAGAGPPSVLYFHAAGAGLWSDPVAFQGPQGLQGIQGIQGVQGNNFDVDATGTYAGRAAHDDEAQGYAYLALDGAAGGGGPAVIYFKASAAHAAWSAPTPFQGPAGATGAASTVPGPAGPPGPKGDNFNVNATGNFAGRAAYDAQAQNFAYLSTNGDGGVNSSASIYIKASNAVADWGPRIPFAGPKGDKGLKGDPGDTGSPGAAGAPGVGVPVGGVTGQGLAKTADANFATGWVTFALKTYVDGLFTTLKGGVSSAFDTLSEIAAFIATAIRTDEADQYSDVANKAAPVGADRLLIEDSEAGYAKKRINISTFTIAGRDVKVVALDTYTLIAGDETKYMRFTHATGCEVEVPDDVFDENDELIMRGTLNQVVLIGDAAAHYPADVNAKSRVAMSTIHLYFTAPEHYDLTGDLEIAE